MHSRSLLKLGYSDTRIFSEVRRVILKLAPISIMAPNKSFRLSIIGVRGPPIIVSRRLFHLGTIRLLFCSNSALIQSAFRAYFEPMQLAADEVARIPAQKISLSVNCPHVRWTRGSVRRSHQHHHHH